MAGAAAFAAGGVGCAVVPGAGGLGGLRGAPGGFGRGNGCGVCAADTSAMLNTETQKH